MSVITVPGVRLLPNPIISLAIIEIAISPALKKKCHGAGLVMVCIVKAQCMLEACIAHDQDARNRFPHTRLGIRDKLIENGILSVHAPIAVEIQKHDACDAVRVGLLPEHVQNRSIAAAFDINRLDLHACTEVECTRPLPQAVDVVLLGLSLAVDKDLSDQLALGALPRH